MTSHGLKWTPFSKLLRCWERSTWSRVTMVMQSKGEKKNQATNIKHICIFLNCLEQDLRCWFICYNKVYLIFILTSKGSGLGWHQISQKQPFKVFKDKEHDHIDYQGVKGLDVYNKVLLKKYQFSLWSKKKKSQNLVERFITLIFGFDAHLLYTTINSKPILPSQNTNHL